MGKLEITLGCSWRSQRGTVEGLRGAIGCSKEVQCTVEGLRGTIGCSKEILLKVSGGSIGCSKGVQLKALGVN